MVNHALVTETVNEEQPFKKGFMQMKIRYTLESAAILL